MNNSLSGYILATITFPRAIYWLATFAYDGLRQGTTLTHRGICTGPTARVWGMVYACLAISYLALLPFPIVQLLRSDRELIIQYLLRRMQNPEIAVMYFVSAVVILAAGIGSEHYVRSSATLIAKVVRLRGIRELTRWLAAVWLVLALEMFLGMPMGIYIGSVAIFFYLCPFATPIALRKMLSASLPAESG